MPADLVCSLLPQVFDLDTSSGTGFRHAIKLIFESPIAITRAHYVNPRDNTSFVVSGNCLTVIIALADINVSPPRTPNLADCIAATGHIRIRPSRQHFVNMCANPGSCRNRVFVNSRGGLDRDLRTSRADKQRQENIRPTHCASAITSIPGQMESGRNRLTNPKQIRN
jgi:hypothetical protein